MKNLNEKEIPIENNLPNVDFFSKLNVNAFSTVLEYTSKLTFKNCFNKLTDENSERGSLSNSITTYSIVGLGYTAISNLIECKKSTQNASIKEVAKLLVENNGCTSLFRGASCNIIKGGLQATVDLSVTPWISSKLQEQGVKKEYANPFSYLFASGFGGFMFTPVDLLWKCKQKELLTLSTRKSYSYYIKDIFKQDPSASNLKRLSFFFKGGGSNTKLAIAHAGLLFLRQKCYDRTFNANNKL